MNELSLIVVTAAPSVQMTISPLSQPSLEIQTGIPATGSDVYFEYSQAVASAEWTIIHNLSKCPSVSVVDSAGSLVFGEVQYISVQELVIRFSAPFSGKAYLN